MTVTVVLSDCPPKLRGDMTKWFIEVNTGVYVGNVSARVKDELWERIVENLGHGHATMIFTAAGEQRMDFMVHNAHWEPVDYDGIKLMRRPERAQTIKKPTMSTAARRQLAAKKKIVSSAAAYCVSDYAIVDFETTGLDTEKDSIIEIGVIVVIRGDVVEQKQMLVKTDRPLSQELIRLTGITGDELQTSGISLDHALTELIEMIEDLPIISHNAAFEQNFLRAACRKIGVEEPENRFIDTLEMSKRLLPKMSDHKLSSLAKYFGVVCTVKHRALADCKTTYATYGKLKELASASM